MSRLDELIAELCPDGVKYLPLEQCCNILDKQRKPVTKSAREKGEYPYYGANGIQDYVSDYIFDGTFVLVGEDGSVITKAGTPVVTWAEGKIWVNNHAHIVEEVEGVVLRYLFHFIQTVNVTPLIHGNIPKLTGGDFKAIPIPVPPLPVQSEIVRILDNFTELTAELTTELTARKKQYEYYKNHIFTKFISPATKYEPLSKIADVRDGTHDSPKPASDGKFLLTSKNVKGGTINYDNAYLISEQDFEAINQRSKVDLWDLLFTMIGTVGEVGMIEEKPDFAIKNVGLIKTDDELLSHFLKYYLTTFTVKKYVEDNKSKGSQVFFALGKLRNIPIPVLGKESMKYIVELMSKFDDICTNISSGLPAEIAARQKQYEYYRDKLLTFKELS